MTSSFEAILNKSITTHSSQEKRLTMPRWGAADDAKLVALWRTPHNGIDPTKLDIDSVKQVHQKHFSNYKYANFAPLYRGKARAFNVSVTLDGHRKSAYHSLSMNCPFLIVLISLCFVFFAGCRICTSKSCSGRRCQS